MTGKRYYEVIDPNQDGCRALAIIDEGVRHVEIRDRDKLKDYNDAKIWTRFVDSAQHNLPSKINPWDEKNSLFRYEDPGEIANAFSYFQREINDCFRDHAEYNESWHIPFLSTFVCLSFFTDLFNKLPRLILEGPPKSGKSTTLEMGAGMSYHGIWVEDFTDSSIFRGNNESQMTYWLDETQDCTGNTKHALNKILKGGYQRGSKVLRTEGDSKNGFSSASFNKFCLVAMANLLGTELDEQITSRSYQIIMARNSNLILPEPDPDRLLRIRNLGFQIQTAYRIYPDLFMLKEFVEKSTNMLKSKDDKADLTSVQNTYGKDAYFTGRTFNNGRVIFSVSRAMGIEHEIIPLLIEQQKLDREIEQSSLSATVHRAFITCIREIARQDLSLTLEQIIAKISTKKIAEACYVLQCNDEDISYYDRIKTGKTTAIMKQLSYDVQWGLEGHKGQNLTYVIPGKKTYDALNTNLKIYSNAEDTSFIQNLRVKKKS